MLKRLLRGLLAQALAIAPDAINWIAGTALPVIPPPWNVLVGVLLNAGGKALRLYGGKDPLTEKGKWTWIPV